MQPITTTSRRLAFPALGLLAATFAIACNRQPDPQRAAAVEANAEAKAEQKQQAQDLAKKVVAAREEIGQILPPSKARYLSVHSVDGWANPFLTIHRDTVELRILFPPGAGSPADGGSSLLHPVGARKQSIDVRLADLPDALAAIPSYAWPYGRVIAVEESEAAKRQDLAQVRRTEEATMQMLNDLGVIVDEWSNNPNSLLH